MLPWLRRLFPALLLVVTAAAQDLVLNDLRPHIVAYEIPDSDGRAEAVRYVEMVRDRFYPGVEIVDAGALDEAALRSKLTGTVVLYTVLHPNSRLLRLAAQPLPLRLQDGTLHWGSFATPVKDVRMVFAAGNPYGDGYFKIYAAGSNGLLAHANDVFHGPASYDIYRGDGRAQLLLEGIYDRNFVERPDRISQANAVADVQEFFATLEHTHPNLLAHVNKSDYEALKKRTMADLPPQVTISELAWRLYFAAAMFKDGHTAVFWGGPRLTEANTQGKRFPPFFLDSENGRYFIAAATDPSLVGAELVTLNGKPVDDFFKPMLERVSGETRTYRAALFVQRQPFWYAYSNVFNSEAVQIGVRDAGGPVRSVEIRTLEFSDWQKLVPQRPRPIGTHVDFLDDGRIAQLVIPNLVYGADRHKTEAVFDDAFARIRERNSTGLIIDIRGNSGGDSSMGDYVLKLVRDFKGKTYMLTDHYDFSSAVIFADTFRDRRVGTLIGYETGGTPTHYGYPQNFTLKYSGIHFICSRRAFRALKPRPTDRDHGVIPDIPATHAQLTAFQNAPDPLLAFAVSRIREERATLNSPRMDTNSHE